MEEKLEEAVALFHRYNTILLFIAENYITRNHPLLKDWGHFKYCPYDVQHKLLSNKDECTCLFQKKKNHRLIKAVAGPRVGPFQLVLEFTHLKDNLVIWESTMEGKGFVETEHHCIHFNLYQELALLNQ